MENRLMVHVVMKDFDMAAKKKKVNNSKKRKADDRDKDDSEEDIELVEQLRRELAEKEAEIERMNEPAEEESAPRTSDRKGRQLVRWDDDHDIRLLLAIQHACLSAGVKIPWQDVAKTLGAKFTEGAITQHLAKVRTRRIAGHKWVPPLAKRGGKPREQDDADCKTQKGKMSSDKQLLPAADLGSGSKGNSRRGGGRNTFVDSSDESDDDIFGMSMNKGRKMHSGLPFANSDGSGNRPEGYGAGQPWLTQFSGNTGLGFDSEGDGYATGSSRFTPDGDDESSETTAEVKKSKIVKLKIDGEALTRITGGVPNASSSRYVSNSSLPAPVTPQRRPVAFNHPPQRQSFRTLPPGMDAPIPAPPFYGHQDMYGPNYVYHPSSGPSLFEQPTPQARSQSGQSPFLRNPQDPQHSPTPVYPSRTTVLDRELENHYPRVQTPGELTMLTGMTEDPTYNSFRGRLAAQNRWGHDLAYDREFERQIEQATAVRNARETFQRQNQGAILPAPQGYVENLALGVPQDYAQFYAMGAVQQYLQPTAQEYDQSVMQQVSQGHAQGAAQEFTQPAMQQVSQGQAHGVTEELTKIPVNSDFERLVQETEALRANVDLDDPLWAPIYKDLDALGESMNEPVDAPLGSVSILNTHAWQQPLPQAQEEAQVEAAYPLRPRQPMSGVNPVEGEPVAEKEAEEKADEEVPWDFF
ncbi:uncharacterized protein N7506_003756 [Penicillium brevicompactum]|uniref:uncharacterized protein n=1 Tax=Penicillium brevicompactum TaxID=5074 RepID=UPI0025420467|nr:uncharacterized protein N7506_003756 [Penicillium brevicompactum]KAJ5343932.1 hypothetical protein N7506_003756 [Penicillium brevicompactum]